MELIKDNYLRGVGNGSTWSVQIDPPRKKVKSYFEESLDVAKYVYENKEGKLLLLYSGGLDSQYVFNLFYRLGFDFTPVIIRLLDTNGLEYNSHETVYAFEYCKTKNIKPLVYDLNFDEFVISGELLTVAEIARCGSFHIPATMHVAKQLGGFTVLGNDPPYLRYNPDTNLWYLEELEIIHSLLNYYNLENIKGCPFLLSYTAEMMLSFLLDPAIQKLGTGKCPGKLGSNSTKVHVFNNGSEFNIPNYDFKTKSRVKYTGYEKIVEAEIINHENFQKFKLFENKWRGEHFFEYSHIVQSLSIHQ